MSISRCPRKPLLATIAAEPQTITVDLKRSAMIVVDMQNDFCAPGGWVDWLGADLTPERAPIKPLQRLLPALRATGVPIIWLNWGNRPDAKPAADDAVCLQSRRQRYRHRRRAARQWRASAREG